MATDPVGQRVRDALVIVAVCLIGSLLLIANPGFYNPDELQKFDYLQKKGLAGYLFDYGQLRHWPHFAYPLRPLGFVVQGLFAVPMGSFLVLTHLASVVVHAGIAVVLYHLLLAGGALRGVSLASAVLFGVSPLATFGAGWVAAIMDPLFTGFTLLGLVAAQRYLSGNGGLLLAGLWFTCAVASKETALIVPLVVVVLLWLDSPPLSSLRMRGAVVMSAALPAAAYLLYRLPDLLASLGGAGGGHYALGWGNAAYNVLVYASYPFLALLPEAGNVTLLHRGWPWVGLTLHLALLAAVWRLYGWRRAVQVALLYLIPLLPVLALAGKGSHYLYASAVPFSVALGAVAIRRARGLAAVLIALTLVHSAANQVFLYRIGACTSRALTTLEARHIAAGRPPVVLFEPDPGGSAQSSLDRIIAGRNRIGESHPVELGIAGAYTGDRSQALIVRFSDRCLVH